MVSENNGLKADSIDVGDVFEDIVSKNEHPAAKFVIESATRTKDEMLTAALGAYCGYTSCDPTNTELVVSRKPNGDVGMRFVQIDLQSLDTIPVVMTRMNGETRIMQAFPPNILKEAIAEYAQEARDTFMRKFDGQVPDDFEIWIEVAPYRGFIGDLKA